MCWDAVAALGQWAGAIATTIAVVVALKPYKKKASVEVQTITIALGNESQTIPMMLTVRNSGGMAMWVDSYGIADSKSKSAHSVATDIAKRIEPNCAIAFPVGINNISEILDTIQSKKIRFWVKDQSGTIYFSEKFDRANFVGSIASDYFS